MGIGTKLREARIAKGWTLDQLEDASGVARGTISALENRDSSRSQFFPALAAALGMTVEQLAAGAADEQPELLPVDNGEAQEAAVRALDDALNLLADALASVDADGRDMAALALQKFAKNPAIERDRTVAMLAAVIQSAPRAPVTPPTTPRTKKVASKTQALVKGEGKANLVLKLGGGQRQMFDMPLQSLRKAVDNRNASQRERDWYERVRAAPKAAAG